MKLQSETATDFAHGIEIHQSAGLDHDGRGGMGNFLQPEIVSVADGGLGCRFAIRPGLVDFENAVGRRAF
jgi:hypothetical protein